MTLNFETKDFVKAVGFVATIGSMWFDLKSEQIEAKKDREFLQYQIEQLKPKQVAILPKELKIENELN